MWVISITILLGLFFAGLAQNLEPINPDNLDPDASHVCSSVIEEIYTVTETYTYYTRIKTYTWCFSIPPRCTQYYSQRHTGARQVKKTRQKKSYFCCDGYETRIGINYCIPTCQGDCNKHGLCVLPEVCICHEGYVGEYCESNCPEGFWGQDCQKVCQCSSHGSCDPETGNCICHVGYTGSDCSHPCEGSFGLHCVYPCVCQNGAVCDNIDGHCTCKPGYYGVDCRFACPEGTTGEECKQTCQCQNGGSCDDNGDCICTDGYTGTYCTEKCDSLHWGQNCSKECFCYNGGKCDPETGVCFCAMGYGGENCQTECNPGFYGRNCGIGCTCEHQGSCYYSGPIRTVLCNCSGTGYHGDYCHNRDCPVTAYLLDGNCEDCDCPWETTDSCNIKTGECQCKPGYHGDRCTDQCEMPFYGKNCEEHCECPHGDCHLVTGECTRCVQGYLGTNCDQKCPAGTWGINCTQACQCQNGAVCSHTTGYCNCSRGYQGLYCAQRCPTGSYGYNCSGVCECAVDSSICSLTDGTCQCLPGYHGSLCEEQCPEGKYGYQCQSNCSCSDNGTMSCDHRTGECLCKSGWKGVNCDSQCYVGTWGENCLQSCECNQHGSCHQLTGACICDAGYVGPQCSQECEPGFYGYRCQEKCQPCPDGAACNFKTGVCPEPGTCPAGFTGTQCQELCPDGFWGEGCANPCAKTCSGNRGRCNPITGKCRCFPGYTGIDCELECPAGTYGIACQMDCDCIENQTAKCDHKTGQCTCKPGFKGDFCQNQCEVELWGPACLFKCSAICNSEGSTGLCDFVTGIPCQCLPGYSGDHCQYDANVNVQSQHTAADAGSFNPTILGIVIAIIVLILAIVIIVIYYRRRVHKLKEDNLQVSFNASGLGIYDNAHSNNTRQVGLVNPTYAVENLNNETRNQDVCSSFQTPKNADKLRRPIPVPGFQQQNREDTCTDARYPHLSAKTHSQPCARKDIDSCDDHRSSGCYDDLDEDRYTTLKGVGKELTCDNGGYQGTSEEVNLNKPAHSSKVLDKCAFYTGPKVPNTAVGNSVFLSLPHDSRSRRNEDSYLKPNNLHLAQQTTVSNPSPATSCSTLGDIEEHKQPLEDPALAFENSQFLSALHPSNQSPNDQVAEYPENYAGESLAFINEQFPVVSSANQTLYEIADLNEDENKSVNDQKNAPNQYDIPNSNAAIYDNPSSQSSSQESLNVDNDENNVLMNSLTNPYDLPIPPDQRSGDSEQPTKPSGSQNLSVNQYDTPRSLSTAASPYDTPKSRKVLINGTEGLGESDLKKALVADLKKAQNNKSVDSETFNGPAECENWITFDDKAGNRQSFA